MLNITKKTKIVCTIGPASDSYERLSEMIKAGMNVMRLNFSHGDYQSHLDKINTLRKVEKDLGVIVPILLDTKGPEIRCHLFEDGAALIERDSEVRVSMTEVLGTPLKFSTTHGDLYSDVKVGDHLKIDDGNLELVVIDKDSKNKELVLKALNTHLVKNRKGVNAPFARLSMPFISERDEQDLKFGCENGVTFVAASFTRRAQDIHDIKKVLAKYNRPDILVIAKIENPEGVESIDEILEVCDGVMVARGDLGVEIPAEEVPVIQKEIVKKCRQKGKPVITATQMLDSMQTHPTPTRAEVSDVANAITEGADCVMLSAESASGEYPVKAVEMQQRIAFTMEKYLNYELLAQEAYDTSSKNNSDAISNSVANTALLIDAKLIVCFSETGSTPKRIAKARPCCPILSVSNSKEALYNLGIFWGVYGISVPYIPQFIEEMEVLALVKAHELQIPAGSPIIITGGTPTGAGKTNFMKIINVNKIGEIYE